MNDRQALESNAHAEPDELFALYIRLFALMVLTGLTGLFVFGIVFRVFPSPMLFREINYMETINLYTGIAGVLGVVGAIGLWFMMKSHR